MLTGFDRLPPRMQNDAVRRYHEMLVKKRAGLRAKRLFDLLVSALMLILLSPIMLILALLVKLDSRGPVFFQQERYTSDMRVFRIYKFRTMIENADAKGPLVTVADDSRITRVGSILRRTRLDELPQLLNVIVGDMSFVGTRPEVAKYVNCYSDEMLATLLLPAGVTSTASIEYKDEEDLLNSAVDADAVYVGEILPCKMRYNLEYLENFSFWRDIRILIATLLAVAGQ